MPIEYSFDQMDFRIFQSDFNLRRNDVIKVIEEVIRCLTRKFISVLFSDKAMCVQLGIKIKFSQ